MKQRTAFVVEASKPRARIAQTCREYGISRQLEHRLLKRYEMEGASGIAPQSRRPRRHPRETSGAMKEELLALRARHPYWGATLLQQLLVDRHGKQAPEVHKTLGSGRQKSSYEQCLGHELALAEIDPQSHSVLSVRSVVNSSNILGQSEQINIPVPGTTHQICRPAHHLPLGLALPG